MAFNVDEMLGVINGLGGLTKSSKFLVRIIPPRQLFGLAGSYLDFLCDSASLPGVSWTTDEIRMPGYGNIEKRPYSSVLTFYNDSDGRVLRFFHQWMQSVYNFNENTNPNATAKNLFNNTFAYPQEYYGNVEIYHFDDSGVNVINYTLIEAYPLRVDDVAVDWNQDSTLLKIPVVFAYTYWSSETLDPGRVSYFSFSTANSLDNFQPRVGRGIGGFREILNVTSPLLIQRQTNLFASAIPLF
jgi:hypothetical protein